MRSGYGKGSFMKLLLMRVTLAVAAATIVGPVRAQVPPQTAALPPYPPPAYSGGLNPSYAVQNAIQAPTPRDAYRDGTLNRWEYEQIVGPLPPALQGPSVDGTRGGDGGDSGGGGRGS
jgi:hypothetical protein